ncbi:MAG: glutathione S-transferase family protein [Alphaproteobacteria bacterium]|jgi:glutathione S-transferase|nr:glutathione S-transferase family protein [Alphaproteobacteria bacterium]
MGQLRVWGIESGRAIRVYWALEELGLDYEVEPIGARTGETQTARYRAINPREKIPALQDGDFTLRESAAIVTYLGQTYDDGSLGLVPSDPLARARYDEWCFFIAMELDATSLYIIRRHKYLSEIYGEAREVVAAAEAYFLRMAATVETALADGRAYLLGEAFTGADILLGSCLAWAQRYEIRLPSGLEAYCERLVGRPAYARALAATYPNGLP